LALGFDGTDLASSSEIDFEVDGTPGANDMPGRIVFKTSADGSQTPTEAMRIDSTQTVTIPKASMTNATVSADLNLTGTLSVNGSSGTSGYVLTSNGASDPTWEPNANGVAIVDDTTTNATRYLTFTSATTGNITTENVSSTKLQYNPSTGVLSSTSFTGAGTGLTGTAASLSIGGNAANVSGTVAVANGGTGRTTLTANNVVLGNGTSAVNFVAPGTSGNVLTSNGSTWTSAAPPSSAPTTAQVLTATAGASVGAVGTYALLGSTNSTAVSAGGTKAGSDLRYSGLDGTGGAYWGTDTVGGIRGRGNGGTPSGTWMAMGRDASGGSGGLTLWLRIS
jgi:hypothetical protein